MLNPTHFTYPRVYRASTFWIVSISFVGALLVLAGIFAAWFLLQQINLGDIRFWISALCLPFVLLGVYALLVTFASSVTLFENRIEVTDLRGTAVFFRDDIAAWRFKAEVILVPKPQMRAANGERHCGPIKIGQLFPVDPPLMEWLSKIPQGSDSLLKPENTVGTNRSLRWALNVCGLIIVVALVLARVGEEGTNPDHHRLTILVLLLMPWACLFVVWQSRGFLHILAGRARLRPNLVFFFVAPIAILTVRALGYNLFDYTPLVKLAIATAMAIFVAALKVDNTASAKALLPICALYGYAVSVEANALFDHSTAINYRVTVRDKQVITGKHRSYRLYLDPWGPLPGLNRLKVTLKMFNQVQPGDTIRISLKQGALGAPWYFMSYPL